MEEMRGFEGERNRHTFASHPAVALPNDPDGTANTTAQSYQFVWEGNLITHPNNTRTPTFFVAGGTYTKVDVKVMDNGKDDAPQIDAVDGCQAVLLHKLLIGKHFLQRRVAVQPSDKHQRSVLQAQPS
jgi:hypothetical protein